MKHNHQHAHFHAAGEVDPVCGMTIDPAHAAGRHLRGRQRHARASEPSPPAGGDVLFRRELPRLERAVATGDAATIGDTVRRWREQSRAWGEAEFLGRWGRPCSRATPPRPRAC